MRLNPVKKAWRSRGFGIHSPFAFRFITAVLRGRGAYYAYPALKQLSVNSREFRDNTVIFRIVCDLCPDLVLLGPDAREGLSATIGHADSRVPLMEIDPDSAESRALVSEAVTAAVRPMLYLCSAPQGAAVAVREVFGREGIVIADSLPADTCEELKSQLVNGMTFTNGRMTVMVSRRDLPRQDFEINF